MKKILFSLIAALVLVGCNESEDLMKCGAYEVQTELREDGTLRAVLNGDEVILNQVMAASGVRYEGVLNEIDVVLWNKGNDWTLILHDEEPVECN